MTPSSLESVQSLFSKFAEVKQRRDPIYSKIVEMERLVEAYAFPPRNVVRKARSFMPATRQPTLPPVSRILRAPVASVAMEEPLTFESEFTDIIDYLDPITRSFLKTADELASALERLPELDWSPAVIGLCKAFERETVHKILMPFRTKTAGCDLSVDLTDTGLNRIAKFCGASAKPPELGTFAYFLKTAIHSRNRRDSSQLLKAFYDLLSQWPQSSWIVDQQGLVTCVERLTAEFRNRAAHIEPLGHDDFTACRSFVRESPEKIIVRLIVATRS